MLCSLIFSARSNAQQIDKWSFIEKPFINPRIIEDLSTWMSDGGDQVVEIDLPESQESNRYFCETRIDTPVGSQYPEVFYTRDGKERRFHFPNYFSYQYVGRTQNGIYVLHTRDQEGGAIKIQNLLLLTFEEDFGIDDNYQKGKRLLIKKLTEIGLSEGWQGSVIVKGNSLAIDGTFSKNAGDEDNRVIDLSPFH